jgi:hypothetical protein
MKVGMSVKLGAALVSGCLALGFAQTGFAQTGSSPSTQHGKAGGQPGANLEESRTPDTTSANDANGNVGEAGGRHQWRRRQRQRPRHAQALEEHEVHASSERGGAISDPSSASSCEGVAPHDAAASPSRAVAALRGLRCIEFRRVAPRLRARSLPRRQSDGYPRC